MAPQVPAQPSVVSEVKPKQKSTSTETVGKYTKTNKHTVAKATLNRGDPTTKSKPKRSTIPSPNKTVIPLNLRDPLIVVDFETYGRVQGVFFRKYTQLQAEKLGVRGWCKNTEQGTVLGQLQGSRSKVEPMKKWLKSVGSPKSTIEKCEFRGEHEIDTITIDEFQIRR